MRNNKIGILHYRIGKTDGVSLEIIKRKKILEKMGFVVKLIAGDIQEGSDYVIPLLEFDNPQVLKIRHNAFEKFVDFNNDNEFEDYITLISDSIKTNFLKIQQQEKFDYLFLHNIFTHGRHIATAKAFYEIALETDIKLIAVNHDFYWVGAYRNIYKPTTKFVKKFLHQYSPPTLPKITHVAINSINKKALDKKTKQSSILLPDTFDFDQNLWQADDYNSDLLRSIGVKNNDIIILQATRITQRKCIELAVDLAGELSKRKSELVGKNLYNGKKISQYSNVVLVLAGYAEKDSLSYKKLIEEKINNLNIKAFFISDFIGSQRNIEKNKKRYSLWDAYVYADLVTYPSIWEGWGNQLIEAVFAKKPIVVFEYPVFRSDIKKEGYKVLSFGERFLQNKLIHVPRKKLEETTSELIRFLLSPSAPEVLDKNFAIGKKYHSDKFLEKKLKEILDSADRKQK